MHYTKVKGILSAKNGMNLYRGCTHGCIYCDSRSSCYNMSHAFEDVEVKENALELLEQALRRKRQKCMIGTGAMTDPYIPLEQELGYMRRALELIYQYGFGVTIITKSNLIMRDLDLLQKINNRSKCVVQMTLTTHDEALCKKLEPHVCSTRERVAVLQQMHEAGIPTVVWLCPILPFINDTEENLRGIFGDCIQAGVYGVICFGMGLTLRQGNREYFYQQLDRHFPRLKEKYIYTYGSRYSLASPNSRQLMRLFHQTCAQHGIAHNNEEIFNYLHTFEEKSGATQLCLFE